MDDEAARAGKALDALTTAAGAAADAVALWADTRRAEAESHLGLPPGASADAVFDDPAYATVLDTVRRLTRIREASEQLAIEFPQMAGGA
jgi:hypothetical protein